MPESTAYLEERWSAELRIVHGLAASLGDSRQRYEASHDARYLRSIENVLPLFRQHLAKMQEIAAKLSGKEMPGELLLSLSETSDWLVRQGSNVVEGVTGTARDLPTLLKYISIAAVVVGLAYISGQAGPLIRAVKGK